jgi:peptidyl-tRNA hydrolase
MSSPPLTHYVIVRSDLPLGFLASQVCHAAGESSPGNLPHSTNAVVLAVPDESTLREYSARLERAGVEHRLICEPDAPWLGQATAIGLAPVADRRPLRAILSSLPLLGKPRPCADCADAGGLCYEHNGGLRMAR